MKNNSRLIAGILILLFLFLNSNVIAIEYLSNLEEKVSICNSFSKNEDKIESIINMITKDLIIDYIETIVSYGPRPTGTYENDQTAEYISNEFQKEGLKVIIQNWSRQKTRKPKIYLTSQNVIGIKHGKNINPSTIIFNAHYDSVKKSPGADDDGSGVAAVLAAAYVLSKFEFEHNIELICFSGEEDGLLGSKEYTRDAYNNKKDILVELNADMISNNNTPEGAKKLRVYGSEDVLWIVDIIENLQKTYLPEYNLDLRTTDEEGRMGSDYASFIYHGYEAIAFFESEFTPYFHTSKDTIENINIDYLVNNTKIIVASIAKIADETNLPPQVMIESPKLGYLYHDWRKIKKIDEFDTIIFNDIWIWADIIHGSSPIEKVEFYCDNKLVYTDYEYPYRWHFNKISFGSHRITTVVYDELGRSSSDWRDIKFYNFFRFD